MSWASTGWDEVDEDLKKSNEGGGGGDSFVREFAVDVGTTRRFVVLDDEPFAFWEHSTYGIPNAPPFENPICLSKNGGLTEQFGNCPFCETVELHKSTKGAQGRECWAAYVGRVTVIDCGTVTTGPTGQALTGWVNQQGKEYNFDRRLLALKRGGQDKPGLLQKFRRFREKKGSLVGYVFDTTRAGKKEERAGTEWEIVGKIDVSTVEKLKAGLKSLDGYRPDAHDPLVAKIAAVGPLPYMEIFKPKPRAVLQAILNGNGKQATNQAPAGSSAFDKPAGSTSGSMSDKGGYSPPDAPTVDPGDEDDSIPF